MNTPPLVEKASAYLSVELSQHASANAGPCTGPFVTLTREAGIGGEAFARALAERLTASDPEHPWQVHSGNLIEEMLRHDHLSPHLARFLPEDRIHEIEASVGEIVGLHPNLWQLVGRTNAIMRDLARIGHCVLLGRGANFATADIAHGVHVRLVADAPFRAASAARRHSLTLEMALAENQRRDAARERYVRANFGADLEELAAYHVVLNLAHIPQDTALEIVGTLVRALPAHVSSRASPATAAPFS